MKGCWARECGLELLKYLKFFQQKNGKENAYVLKFKIFESKTHTRKGGREMIWREWTTFYIWYTTRGEGVVVC